MASTNVEIGPEGVMITCSCGWHGNIQEVSQWKTDHDRNLFLRCCPACKDPRPEWGTFGPVEVIKCITQDDMQAAVFEE